MPVDLAPFEKNPNSDHLSDDIQIPTKGVFRRAGYVSDRRVPVRLDAG